MSGGYKPEAISAAVWVLEKNIDITLIKLDIYEIGEDANKTQLINIDRILPSADLSNELVRLKTEQQRTRSASQRAALHMQLWSEIQQRLNEGGVNLFSVETISDRPYFNGKNIRGGLSINMGLNDKDALSLIHI